MCGTQPVNHLNNYLKVAKNKLLLFQESLVLAKLKIINLL